MSSFRVERQRVSYLPQAEIVWSDQTPQRRGENELSLQKEQLDWEKEQVEHTRAYLDQMRETAKHEADEQLRKAQREAEKLLAETQEQARLLMERERERGLADGRKAAEEENRQRKAQEEEELQQLQEQLRAQYQDKVDEVQGSVAELAMEIAEKIIDIKLEETDTAFLNVVEGAMSRFRHGENITALLSDEDYQRYSKSENLSQAAKSRGKTIVLEKNASFHKGDCVLETESQFVDCGVSGQLTRLGKLLREGGGEECEHEPDFAKVQGSLAEG